MTDSKRFVIVKVTEDAPRGLQMDIYPAILDTQTNKIAPFTTHSVALNNRVRDLNNGVYDPEGLFWDDGVGCTWETE